MTSPRDDRSLGELFGDLSSQTSTLVKKEIELARTEMTSAVTTLARDSAAIVAGALIAYLGAIVLLIGIAWILATLGLPIWLAFLIVGGVTLLIGAGLAWWAIQSLKKVNVMPERTMETIKQDIEWAKDQTK